MFMYQRQQKSHKFVSTCKAPVPKAVATRTRICDLLLRKRWTTIRQ